MSERVGVPRTLRTSAINWHAREELQPEQPAYSCTCADLPMLLFVVHHDTNGGSAESNWAAAFVS